MHEIQFLSQTRLGSSQHSHVPVAYLGDGDGNYGKTREEKVGLNGICIVTTFYWDFSTTSDPVWLWTVLDLGYRISTWTISIIENCATSLEQCGMARLWHTAQQSSYSSWSLVVYQWVTPCQHCTAVNRGIGSTLSSIRPPSRRGPKSRSLRPKGQKGFLGRGFTPFHQLGVWERV